MQRWRINNGGGFLLYCMVHVPALSSFIFTLGGSIVNYVWGFSLYGWGQLPMAVLTAPFLALLAVPFGILFCLLPGLLGGCALVLLAHFRAPTTLEFLAGAALAASLPGFVFFGGVNGPGPYLFAAIGVVSTLAVVPRAKRLGIIVPYVPASAAPSSAPA